MGVRDNMRVRGEVSHIRGITCIIALVISIIGGITLWSVMDGVTSVLGYYSALLVIVALLNLVGYLMLWPLMFAISAALFWAAAPYLMDYSNSVRIGLSVFANRTLRASLAGLIILFIGSAVSFFGVPTRHPKRSRVLDYIMLAVIAVFLIIGGALLADLGLVVNSAQVFIVLFFFIIAIIFGAKSLLYAALILGGILFTVLLPGAFPGATHKSRAAFILSWLGMLFMCGYIFHIIQIRYGEDDRFAGKDRNREEHAKNTTTKNQQPAAPAEV